MAGLRKAFLSLCCALFCSACTPLLYPVNPIFPRYETNFAEEHFPGKWCGKWDGVFSVCYTITRQKEKVFDVLYEWEEVPGQEYGRQRAAAVLINRNTLRFGGTYIRIDMNDPRTGSATGIFFTNSRLAILRKEDAVTATEEIIVD